MQKQVIILRSDLDMGKGKMVSQGAHASLLAYKEAPARIRRGWDQNGAKKVVVKVSGKGVLMALYRKALAAKLPAAVVRDAGLTQTCPGEVTAVGIGPADEGKIDAITGTLQLL